MPVESAYAHNLPSNFVKKYLESQLIVMMTVVFIRFFGPTVFSEISPKKNPVLPGFFFFGNGYDKIKEKGNRRKNA